MKKILFTTAILSLLFTACSRHEVKLLPSEITYEQSSIHFEYDNENRFIKWSRNDDRGGAAISYCADGNPLRVGGNWGVTFAFESDHRVVVSWDHHEDTDVLTIDADGQLVRLVSRNKEIDYTYDADGNITGIVYVWRDETEAYKEEVFITYSPVKSIWRHVNAPDWFLLYFADMFPFFSKMCHMPAQRTVVKNGVEQQRSTFTHELDANGYVRQKHRECEEKDSNGQWQPAAGRVVTVDYVSAR